MRRIIPMLFIITLIMAVGLMAHDEKEHAKPDSTPAVTHKQEQGRLPGLDDFPSLHPLVVHFPIVLLLIAPGLWLLGLWSKTRSHFYIAFTLGALGLLGAYMAGSWFHPHAHELSDEAQTVLDLHDQWADWTIITAGLTLITMGGALWLKQIGQAAIRVLGIAALVLGFSAALCVARTGHYGAALTHIYGIGPQGEHLEGHSGHEH